MLKIVALALVAFSVSAGCGKKKKEETGASGQARMGLSNSTSLAVTADPTYFPPTLFGVKITSVSLSTHSDTTQGSGSAIWINPDCPLIELQDQKTEGEVTTVYKYIGVGSCPIANVKTYLDIARSSDLVNADLNSQFLPILPNKTYNYAQISICVGTSDSGDNLKFQTAGMTAASEVRTGTCGFATAQFATPVTVDGSTKIKVSLKYDLSRVVYDYGEGMSNADYCYFSDDSSVRRCAQIPDLTAEITAE